MSRLKPHVRPHFFRLARKAAASTALALVFSLMAVAVTAPVARAENPDVTSGAHNLDQTT